MTYRRMIGGLLSLCVFFCVARNQARGDSLSAIIDRYVAATIDSKYAASVLTAVDETIILKKGYGWTDSTRKYPATEKTLFNVASITKSFTANAIFLLKDQGRLRLDDTLPVFFKDVPKEKQPITVRQLLLHTSGLKQNYASDGVTERDLAVAAILKDELKFAPGSDFSYSNENYELLAAIIEVVSGMSYEDFVRRNILVKAKMDDTRFWAEAAALDSQAAAQKNRELHPENLRRNWGYIGSGGLYTTVGDLYRWFTSLRNGDILSPESLSLLWEPQKELSATGVAYGWFVSNPSHGQKEIWTRGTEDWGHNGVLRWFPERRTVIIVLTNSGELGDKSETGNRLISDGIAKILFE
jgi:CubicO group peptidase (beta-lactamase class C family)